MVDLAQTLLLLVATGVAFATYLTSRSDRKQARHEARVERVATAVVHLGEEAVLDTQLPARGAYLNAAKQRLRAALALTSAALPACETIATDAARSTEIVEGLLDKALQEIVGELARGAD